MAEVAALKKHPCPECGGDAEWDPSKKALACPYCGTILPWTDGTDPLGAVIVEHDLEQALAATPDDSRGLRSEKRSVKCESSTASLREIRPPKSATSSANGTAAAGSRPTS